MYFARNCGRCPHGDERVGARAGPAGLGAVGNHAGRAPAESRRASRGARPCLLRRLHRPRHTTSRGSRRQADRCCAVTCRTAAQHRSKCASATTRFDNTHPLRGDVNAGPRITRVNLPLTDDETPIRQELWRGTDRAYKQSAEALTRARTNAAAKIQEDDPSPDFSREEVQVHAGPPAAFTLDSESVGGAPAAPLGAVRRRPADLPKRRLAHGRSHEPLHRQQRGLADRDRRAVLPDHDPGGHQSGRRHGAAAVQQLLRAPPRRPANRSGAGRRSTVDDGAAGPSARGAARRSVLRAGHPVGARRRRLLPRDLRPPRRGPPSAERGRCADVRQARRPAGAAVVSERDLRSHAPSCAGRPSSTVSTSSTTKA